MYIKNIQDFIKKHPVETIDEETYHHIVNDLNNHNFYYYVKSNPIISDYEYDMLFSYLKQIEKKHPNFITSYSPTQRLVNQLQTEFEKAEHKFPLLSLENTYSSEDVQSFIDKLTKDYSIKDWFVEPKYDGLSIELIYKNGYFHQAITRWDGRIWEDVTENTRTIRSLPLKINYKQDLHIRWEVIIKKSIFNKVNKQREKENLTLYSNPRNLASWSLRQLDASITQERKLDVIVYEILNYKDLWFTEHTESLDFLEKNNFFVYDLVSLWLLNQRKGLDSKMILDIVDSKKIKETLDKQDVDFDGLVIKVNNTKIYDDIGYTNHHPKWAFSYKYPAVQVTSKILDVEFSVWRTWVITPVSILEPVNISWVTVKRATLHNFDFIKEKDIRIGDYVFLQRSWEVIPYIVSVIKEKRQGNLKKIEEPIHCPVCNWKTFHPENEVALRCVNVSCPAQVKEKIAYFVWKQGLDIDWLWEKTIDTFFDLWIIKDYWDIFYIKKEDIIHLPLFKEKKVENILVSIEKKKNVNLVNFLASLWIEFVWKKTAKIIVDSLLKDKLIEKDNVNLQKLIQFLITEEWKEYLINIKWLWPKVVQSITMFFNEEHNKKVIEKILKKVNISIISRKWKFVWKTYAISWSVRWIDRNQIINYIEENWWEFTNQITKDTNYILVWEKPWNSKLKKAKEYNIQNLDLKKFLKENNFDFPNKTIKEESLF